MGIWGTLLRIGLIGVGYLVGGPLGAFVGGAIGGLLFPVQYDIPEGPRLDKMPVQTSAFGEPIYELWGTMRFAGNVIWMGPVREVRSEEEDENGNPYIKYSYYASFAVGLCRGPIDRVLRIWANSELIWSTRWDEDAGLIVAELAKRIVGKPGLQFRVYDGGETQTVCDWMEEEEGVGNVPAYKGLTYIIFRDLPIEPYGNQIPNISLEVSKDATDTVPHVELHGIESTIWGSDNLVFHPDEVFATIYAAGYWNRFNTLTNQIVLEVNHLRGGGGAEISDDTGDFDIDERNIIHTSKYSATSNYSYLCQLDGDTYAERLVSSGDDYWSPSRIRV